MERSSEQLFTLFLGCDNRFAAREFLQKSSEAEDRNFKDNARTFSSAP